MEPRHLIRAAIAFSVIGHLALVVGVFFADARPFEPSEADTVAVDVVTPEQVAAAEQAAETPPPKPEPPKPEFRLPDLDKPTLDDSKVQPEAPKPPPAAQQSAQQAAPAPPPPSQEPASQPPSPPQAAVQPPPQPAPAYPAPPTAEPDLTVKYGVQLGLPEGGGAVMTEKADIEPLAIEAFRRHLRSCSTLPAAVPRTERVRIVLRAFLAPDGKLLTGPTLIAANPSVNGPLLMQAAIQALQACQPYTMLPADRYQEWKVLDLVFTPQDFIGG